MRYTKKNKEKNAFLKVSRYVCIKLWKNKALFSVFAKDNKSKSYL